MSRYTALDCTLTSWAWPLLLCFQISVIGDNEDWLMVHQLINEPHARSMEVPALNPYTFYRCLTLTIAPQLPQFITMSKCSPLPLIYL